MKKRSTYHILWLFRAKSDLATAIILYLTLHQTHFEISSGVSRQSSEGSRDHQLGAFRALESQRQMSMKGTPQTRHHGLNLYWRGTSCYGESQAGAIKSPQMYGVVLCLLG